MSKNDWKLVTGMYNSLALLLFLIAQQRVDPFKVRQLRKEHDKMVEKMRGRYV